jgi:hypothetical protein
MRKPTLRNGNAQRFIVPQAKESLMARKRLSVRSTESGGIAPNLRRESAGDPPETVNSKQ